MGDEHAVVARGRERRESTPSSSAGPRCPTPTRSPPSATPAPPTASTRSSRRQLDVLHDAFAPHQVPEDLRRRLVELETSVEATFNTFRGEIDGERVDDNAILEILRTSDDSGERRRGVGGVEAGRRRGRRSTCASSPACATRPPGRSGTATTSRSRSRPASWTRTASSPRSTRSTATPASRSRRGRPSSTTRSRARFGCAVDELRPWHSTTRSSRTRRRAARSTSTRVFADARPRGAHAAHLRRPRPRRPPGPRPQRPLRARRQEPARVLHRHRPRGRRARALQRRAERALDWTRCSTSSATRIYDREVERDAAVAPARRVARAHHRGRRDALRPAGARPEWLRRGRGRRRRRARRARARARRARGGPRCSRSPAGCS